MLIIDSGQALKNSDICAILKDTRSDTCKLRVLKDRLSNVSLDTPVEGTESRRRGFMIPFVFLPGQQDAAHEQSANKVKKPVGCQAQRSSCRGQHHQAE